MPDFSKARDPLDVLDMMTAPTRALSEGVWAANEDARKLRELLGALDTILRYLTPRPVENFDRRLYSGCEMLRAAINEARKP